jgi:aquaporin Z
MSAGSIISLTEETNMALRKYLTEFIGTFFLVLTIGFATTDKGVGSLAPLAIGCVLLAMVYMGGHVSGAHYNPAVSLAVLIRGKMAASDFVPYIIAQLLGAVCAALSVEFIRGVPFGVHIGKEAGMLHPLFVEFLFTFALALVVVNVATAPKAAGNSFYGIAIGLVVTAGAWAVGSVSGAAFNPSVGFGANFVESLHSGAAVGFNHHWIYWVGPLAGGLLAGLVCNFQVREPGTAAG